MNEELDRQMLQQLIKDEKEFSSLIMRLGYTVATKEKHLYYIFMKSMNLVVASDFYLYRTPGDIITDINRHIGHKHVMCKECHTVLLEHDKDKLLAQIASIIEDTGITNHVYGRKLEYRVATEGPGSEPITECPKCGGVVDEDSVGELFDE